MPMLKSGKDIDIMDIFRAIPKELPILPPFVRIFATI